MKAVSIAVFAGMVACALAQLGSAAEAAKYEQRVLYSFGAAPDGENPYASVIDVRGTLYGTTYDGGNYDCDAACGTVFALDLNTGAEKLLYSFDGTDGANPAASLIDEKGRLYSTTSGDGIGTGTVFSLDLNTGAEKTIYSFCTHPPNCTDGAYPIAGLINVQGTLYGTTLGGGAKGLTGCNSNGCGTVFSVNRNTGAEKVLYSFCSQANCADGAFPGAGLIDVNGTLYGTTENGGVTGCGNGCGTVFSIDPNTGAQKTLYTFCSQQNCADGATPIASLIDANGALYGTTKQGGSTGCGGNGCGTVFSIDPSTGVEKVLYSFLGGTDGAQPVSTLIDVNGALYGTAFIGGGTGCGHGGCGTAFSIDPNTGTEKVLYSFCSHQNCLDGADPQGGLISVKGTLYGTTVFGGAYGYGIVFSLKKKR